MAALRHTSTFDDYLPTVSGAAGTPLDRARLDFEGRRMLGAVRPDLATDPIHVYAGLEHGDAVARAIAICDELERLGAGARTWLVVANPTGRGWANHVLLRALAAFTDGDIAIAASQFGAKRSVKSTYLLDDAVRSMTALLDQITSRPALASRKLLVVGESFGAWTISAGLDAVESVRPSGVLMVATPGVSAVRRQDAQLERMREAGVRVIRFDRPFDPVVAIPGWPLIVRPYRQWRATGTRFWLPVVTALRARSYVERVTRMDDPERIDLTVHDYRRDLPPLAAQLAGVTDAERIAATTAELLRLEVEESTWLRDYGPAPHLVWPGLGA